MWKRTKSRRRKKSTYKNLFRKSRRKSGGSRYNNIIHEFEDLHDAELPEDTSNNEEKESFLFHDAHELYPENPNYDVVVKYFPRSYASLDSIVLPQETNDSDNESAITTADNTDYDTDDSPPPTSKHTSHVLHFGDIPTSNRDIEIHCMTEHIIHNGDIRNIPSGNILIEKVLIFKQIAHVRD